MRSSRFPFTDTCGHRDTEGLKPTQQAGASVYQQRGCSRGSWEPKQGREEQQGPPCTTNIHQYRQCSVQPFSRYNYPHFTEKETEAQGEVSGPKGLQLAAGGGAWFPRLPSPLVLGKLLLTSPMQPWKGELILVAGDSCTEGSTPPR